MIEDKLLFYLFLFLSSSIILIIALFVKKSSVRKKLQKIYELNKLSEKGFQFDGKVISGKYEEHKFSISLSSKLTKVSLIYELIIDLSSSEKEFHLTPKDDYKIKAEVRSNLLVIRKKSKLSSNLKVNTEVFKDVLNKL